MNYLSHYLKLRGQLTVRKLNALGVHPLIGFLVAAFIFYFVGNALLDRYTYGGYFIVVLQYLIVQAFHKKEKIHFLKSHFTTAKVFVMRFAENAILSVFFCFFLVYHALYLETLLSFFVILLSSVAKTKTFRSFTIPTPFKSNAYELIIGFRKYWFLLLFSYILLGISIYVGNYNLGYFSLMLIVAFFLISYRLVEKPFYVWIYDSAPSLFLRKKIKSAVGKFMLCCVPSSLVLCFVNPLAIDVLLLTLIYGCLVLSALILFKYNRYPKGINLAEGFTFFIAMIVVPFFAILIPMYYKKAVKHLNVFLHAYS